jgi:uncharacterized membrane protein YbhN (UPF0104 family)
MGNNVLPARAGDVLRVSLLMPRVEGGARTVIGTLAAERLLDAATLLGLFALLGYVLLDGVGAPNGARLAIVAAAVVLAAAAVAGGLALARRRGRGQRLRDFVAPMTSAIRELRGRHGAVMLAATLAIWLLEAGTWYGVGLAADLGMEPIEALYLVALASVFVLIPSGPGYAGTLDAAVVFGVEAIGAGGAAAVSYLLLLRFVLLVPITLAGLAVLVARYGGWQSRRAATSPMGSGAS